MILPLIRLVSLVSPPLLSGGFVVTTMLVPGLLIRSVGQSPAAVSSESNIADEGNRSHNFVALLALPFEAANQSATRPTALRLEVQARAVRFDPSSISASGDRALLLGKTSLFETPTKGTTLELSQNERRNANGTISASSSASSSTTPSEETFPSKPAARASDAGQVAASKGVLKSASRMIDRETVLASQLTHPGLTIPRGPSVSPERSWKSAAISGLAGLQSIGSGLQPIGSGLQRHQLMPSSGAASPLFPPSPTSVTILSTFAGTFPSEFGSSQGSPSPASSSRQAATTSR